MVTAAEGSDKKDGRVDRLSPPQTMVPAKLLASRGTASVE